LQVTLRFPLVIYRKRLLIVPIPKEGVKRSEGIGAGRIRSEFARRFFCFSVKPRKI